MTKITLPWPPKGLQPHAKGNWFVKAAATRSYRRDAFYAAREAGVVRDQAAVIVIVYHPPDRRRRDAQNMPGQLKPAIDGIADAMGCDDRDFRVRFPDSFALPYPGGLIIITIEASG